MLAVPMLALFEGSLIVMWLGDRRAARAQAATDANTQPAE